MAETNTESKRAIKKVSAEALLKGTYEATFADGTVVRFGLEDVKEDARESIRERFFQYGLKQKLDDAMAGASDVQEAIEELGSTIDAIKAGNWTVRVAGEGVEGGLFARAWSERHGVSLADAKAKIGALVERNVAKNRAANPGKEETITERAVFNQIRLAALDRDADLKAIYDALKEKKAKKKSTKQAMEIDLSE